MNYGDFPLEETIHVLFTTRAFATGIPGVLSASTVAVYEDITATPIQTSVAVTETLNSINGLNAVPIVATAANGYEVGKNYHVVIEAGTVDSVSVVGEVIAYFSIGRSAAAVDLANVTDGLGALKTLIDAVQTVVDKVPVSDGTNSWNATALAAIQSEADSAITANTKILAIEADTNELQVDDYPTSIAAIQTVVDKIPLSDGVISWNATALAAIQSEADAAVTANTKIIAIEADTNELQVDDYPTSIAALQTDLDTLTDARGEPAQGTPGASETLLTKIDYLYKAWRNKSTQTATTYSLFNDDATTVDHKATVSDDATTATKGEVATGP